MIKNRLYWLWENGYLYLFLSLLLFLIFALNDRIGVYDWQKEVAYFQYIKTSLTSFQSIPWIWWNKLENIAWYPAVSFTSNFVSNPETMLFSPFTPLLFFMDVLPFVKLLGVVHCLIGIAGSIAVKIRFGWDSQQFRIYAILFLISPIVIQHLSIGYTPWLNLFFFPWIIFYITSERSILGVLGTSIILSLVLLQGGTHIFIWFIILTSLLLIIRMIIERKWDFRLPLIFCITPILSFARIFSTAQAYSTFFQPFQAGYNPINFIFWGLIPPISIPPINDLFVKLVWMGVPSWDGGVYWGLALIVIFILLGNFRRYTQISHFYNNQRSVIISLFVVSFILLFLSFFSIFESIIATVNKIIHIPFSEGAEKYPFRLAIPAYLGFSVVIATYWNLLSKSLSVFWLRLGRSLFLTRLAYAFGNFSFGASVLFIIMLLASITLSTQIKGPFQSIIGSTSISKIDDSSSAIQGWLLIGLGFFIFAAILLRNNKLKIELKIEFALIFPLLFTNIFWLNISISVPFNQYPVQRTLPPHVVTIPNNIVVSMSANTHSLTIFLPDGAPVNEIIFPQLSSTDSKFLTITSNNGKLTTSNGLISLLPMNNQPINIEFNRTSYNYAIMVTVLAWLGSIIFLSVKIIGAFWTPFSTHFRSS